MIDLYCIYGGGFLCTGTNRSDERAVPADHGRTFGQDASSREKDFISGNFILSGNTSFEEADIICIGDPDHSSYLDDALTAELLRLTAKAGDTVLVESVQSGKEVNRHRNMKTDLVEEEIKVLGWDDEKAREKSLSLISLHLSIYGKGPGDPTYDKNKPLIDSVEKEIMDLNIEKRGASLLSALIASCSKGRTFVLAGSGHFLMDQNLLDFLKTKSFTVLSPVTVRKDPDGSADPVSEYYNGSFRSEKEMMLNLKTKIGGNKKAWAGWFKDGEKAGTGAVVVLDSSVCTEGYSRYFGLDPETRYEVIGIRRYRLNF